MNDPQSPPQSERQPDQVPDLRHREPLAEEPLVLTQPSAAQDPPGHLQEPLVVVLSSEASAELAEALARQLLERRLVACASLLPVRSHYLWQGRIESAGEVKLLLKTSPALLDPLHRALLQLHSYETPEWIVLQGSSDAGYGGWLQSVLPAVADPLSHPPQAAAQGG